MKFVKGQWYVIGNDYYEYNEVRCTGLNDNLHWFRKAGELNETPFGDPIATPASLTPDFSDAKVGDECFGSDIGLSHITWVNESDIQIKYLSKSDFDQTAIFWKNNGKAYGHRVHDANGIGYVDWESAHPTLFNSFAQFISYWAEEGLKMKGGDSE